MGFIDQDSAILEWLFDWGCSQTLEGMESCSVNYLDRFQFAPSSVMGRQLC